MGSKYEWFARRRYYDREVQSSILIPAISHPLKLNSFQTSSVSAIPTTSLPQSSRSSSTSSLNTLPPNKLIPAIKEITKEPKFVDPLGVTLAADNADFSLLGSANVMDGGDAFLNSSLSSKSTERIGSRRNVMENTLIENDEGDRNGNCDQSSGVLVDFEPWSSKRTRILQRYTTDEKLSIVTSFLPGGVPLKTQIAVTDKLKHRLEQLDISDSSERRHSDLNQKQYIEKINELNRELMKAWRDDQRVQAIKIVIQSTKLLSTTTVAPHFYPSQFVLITDILDTFGRLVYDRLYTKAIAESPPAIASRLSISSTAFSHTHVPESTKETCRNWFYKVASIRELLVRFYVETCILTSMRFISGLEAQQRCLCRLAEMIRGFSDPLVAAYARAYLCRVGMNLDPKFKDHIWRCFHDTMTTYDRSISSAKYPDLYTPAFQWLLQCLTYECTNFDLGPIFEYCRQKKSPLLLACCIKATPPKLLVEGLESPLEWTRLIRECKQQKLTNHALNNNEQPTEHERELFSDMIRYLGKAVIAHEPLNPDDRLRLLNEAWKLFMRDPKIEFYLHCAQVWFEFACIHFGPREVNTLLDDIIKKCSSMDPKSTTDGHVDERSVGISLFNILEKILRHLLPKNGPRSLFEGSSQFVQFLDLLRTDDFKRREACERVLSSLCDYIPVGTVDDAELANHVLQLCRTLHDGGLNEASSGYEDEKRRLARLICLVLDRFDFCGPGEEFVMDGAQKQLEFLVDCRGSFCNLDDVQVYVVHRFNALAVKASAVHNRTRKTAAFVRSCVANSYITIPSIGGDHFIRLKLYLESTNAALFNNCLVQADALLKACISLILDVPPFIKVSNVKQKSTEWRLVDFIQELMALLLIVPDSPEERHGGAYLYLFEGLLNAIRRYPWPETSDAKFTLLLNSLRFLSTIGQPELPYKIESIISNDTLYGGDTRFLDAVRSSANVVIQELLDYLKKLDSQDVQRKRRQTILALDMVECILNCGDLDHESVRTLSWNLWNLAKKNTVNGLAGQCKEVQVKVRMIMENVKGKYRLEGTMNGGNDSWTELVEKFQPF